MSERAPRDLLADLPARGAEEAVDELLRAPGARIERIVSHGHRSPDGFWYEQEESEWVIVLAGRGAVLFEGEAEAVVLGPGQSLLIPARARHRVEWTAADEPTVWLAVFVGSSDAPPTGKGATGIGRQRE